MYPTIAKICLYCGNEYYGARHSKYCSTACGFKFTNEKRGRKTTGRKRNISIVIDGKKKCKSCEEFKEIKEYRVMTDKRNGKNYYHSSCKSCESDRCRRMFINLSYDERCNQKRRYAEKRGKTYIPASIRKANKEKIPRYPNSLIYSNAIEAFKWWFAKKTDDQVKEWYESSGKPWLNPRLSDTEKWKIRYKEDNEFHVKQRMRLSLAKEKRRSSIGDTIRSSISNNINSRKVKEELGYSIHDLMVHLEKQFTKGMTWEKFKLAKIHIDHIIPQSSFNMQDRKEWKRCWSLPNLRPMWASDNIKKGAKMIYLI